MENVKHKKIVVFILSLGFMFLLLMVPVRAAIETQMVEEVVKQNIDVLPEVRFTPRERDEAKKAQIPVLDIQKETLRQLQIMNNTLLRIEQKL